METIYAWQEKLKRRSILALFVTFLYFLAVLFFLSLYLTGDTLTSLITSLVMASVLVGFETWKAYNDPKSVVSFITGATRSENRRLNDIVEKMVLAYGIKNVEVYIVPWPVINAFVVSKRDKHYLFVTEGALRKLDDEELENVIAHEFAHMENGDSFIMTVAVIVAGLTILIGYYFLNFFPRSEREGSRAQAIAFLVALLLILLAPIVTRILLSAISKEREFLADARAVEVTKYPPGLINALVKVAFENTEYWVEKTNVPRIFGALFFDFEDIETHPPVYERIRRIAELTKTPVDRELLEQLKRLGV